MTAGRVPRDGRRHKIQARIAWVLLAADVAAFVVICKLVDFDGLGMASGAAVMGVPLVAAIGLAVWGVSSSADAGNFARLEGGRNAVASWIVDAATWQQRMNVRRASGIVGTFDMPAKRPPAGGTEVVVAPHGIFVGRSYTLPLFPVSVAAARIRDDWLEIEFDPAGAEVMLGLAIGRDARLEAEKVVRYFRERTETVASEPERPGSR